MAIIYNTEQNLRERAATCLEDDFKHNAIRTAQETFFVKRGELVEEFGDWESMRQRAVEIRSDVTRNLDYYAILKYCERHPANGVPHLAARDCAVWKSKSPLVEPKAKKIGKKRGRHARRATSHKSRRKRHSRR